MNHFNSFRNCAFWLPAIILFLQCPVRGQQIDFAKTAGVHGGLVVQLGATDTDVAAELSKTGRYLIHVLDSDPETVRLAPTRFRVKWRYRF